MASFSIGYSSSSKYLSLCAESLSGKASPFAACIRMSAKRPALALETLEHLVDQIECSNNRLVLDFVTMEALNEVHRHIDGSSDFLLITSHQGCDLEGERNVRL